MSTFISTELLGEIVTYFNYSVDALLVKALTFIRSPFFLSCLILLCLISIINAYNLKHQNKTII
nr:MAG TPA: hypothetical protein [Caudoviricetes sp.]